MILRNITSPVLAETPNLNAAMAKPPLVIWQREVKRLLRYGELVPRLEVALGKFSRRDAAEVVQPVRSSVPLHKHNG